MALPLAQADTCYSTFRGYYECNGSGLSTGARWGIGVGLVLGIILLCMAVSYWRRKRIMSAWKKHTQNNPNELPYHNNQNSGDYNNNNNTAYPQANNYGNYNTQQYAAPNSAYPIKEPQQVYTPSMAGAYGNNGTYQYGQNTNNTNADNNGMSTHDYEYRQAEENRLREEAEARQGSGNAEPAPPGYDSATRPGEPARTGSY